MNLSLSLAWLLNSNTMPFFCREHGQLDGTSLKALKELIPTVDEQMALKTHMRKAGESEDQKAQAFSDLSECERYMLTIMEISDSAAKFDCMIFRDQFRPRYDETVQAIRVVEQACDEVRTSNKLQQIIAMILTLVNQINTGGDGNEAAGFSLDALLKLNEVGISGPQFFRNFASLTP